MVDSVIAGTGNSRYLRTSLSASTTWEDALTMLRAGTFPIDLAGINAAGFITLGTALTAATLLKAAVCTALGLSSDATPSDAWEVIISRINGKQAAPSSAGTTGQVLGLDNNLAPVWVDQSGGGLTTEIKDALLQLAEKVAYIDANGQDYYDDLYDALYPPATMFTVTNALTGCTNSNVTATVAEGTSYSGTITAATGYSLTGATVSITMSGTDITASAYSNGTISIASVTGDVVITVTAVAVTLTSISAVFTQGQTVVYDTDSLDSLKSMLVVTATYSDSSTQTVPSTDYTLSGTLTAGTSTVTVSYGGKTDTFTVTVTHDSQPVRTYFSNVNPTLNYLKKTNGSDQSLNGAGYVELDYVDGMYIHTRMNRSWSAYLNIVMYNGTTYSSTPMTQTGSEAYPTYENTLTGYTGITKVYVNFISAVIADCYYEVEG